MFCVIFLGILKMRNSAFFSNLASLLLYLFDCRLESTGYRLENLITGWRIVAAGWRFCFQAGESDDRLESLATGSKVSFEAE